MPSSSVRSSWVARGLDCGPFQHPGCAGWLEAYCMHASAAGRAESHGPTEDKGDKAQRAHGCNAVPISPTFNPRFLTPPSSPIPKQPTASACIPLCVGQHRRRFVVPVCGQPPSPTLLTGAPLAVLQLRRENPWLLLHLLLLHQWLLGHVSPNSPPPPACPPPIPLPHAAMNIISPAALLHPPLLAV